MSAIAPPPVTPDGGTVVFRIPLTSAMTGGDRARLARLLDLSTHMRPTMRPDPASPGVARLDDCSGLFLERAEPDGGWVLEARTWGRPAAETVRGWRLMAAYAARAIDPGVPLPAGPRTLR